MSVTDIFKKVFGSKADRDMKQLKPILNKILAAYDNAFLDTEMSEDRFTQRLKITTPDRKDIRND